MHRLSVVWCSYSIVFRFVSSEFELHDEVPHAKTNALREIVSEPRSWEYLENFREERERESLRWVW